MSESHPALESSDLTPMAHVPADRPTSPRPVSSTTLGIAYFLVLGGAGAWIPFFGPYLRSIGHGGATFGVLIAVMTGARLVAAPLWSALADRTQRGDLVLMLTSFLSVVAVALALWLHPRPIVLSVLLLIFAASRAPLTPLLDAQTLGALERDGRDALHYGHIRRWGSIGYLLVCVGAGWVADQHPRAPLDLAVGVWGLGALLTLTFPRAPAAPVAPVGPALSAFIRQPFFAPFLVACVLHGVALTIYDNTLGIHVTSIGLASRWTSAAIVVGVGAEALLMSAGRTVLTRIDPLWLMAVAMMLGAVRWILTAAVTQPAALVAIQALHGVVFGGFWIGGVELLRRHAPDSIRATSQAVLAAASYGIGSILSGAAVALWLERACTKGLLSMGAVCSAVAALFALWAGHRDRRGAPVAGADSIGHGESL